MDDPIWTMDAGEWQAPERIRESLRHVALAHQRRQRVDSLRGFNKHTHRVPATVNAQTRAFVAQMGADHVRDDLDQIFQALRSTCGLKRSELQSSDTEPGAGAIATPWFQYSSAVFQDPNTADEAIWRRQLDSIADLDSVKSRSVDDVFSSVFDRVELASPEPINLEMVIDRIEQRDDQRVQIDYDRQVTYCRVKLQGRDETIHIDRDTFQIIYPGTELPRVLLESLFRVQVYLLDGDSTS